MKPSMSRAAGAISRYGSLRGVAEARRRRGGAGGFATAAAWAMTVLRSRYVVREALSLCTGVCQVVLHCRSACVRVLHLARPGEELEVAPGVRLGDLLVVERAVTALVPRGRRRPLRPPAHQLLLTHVELEHACLDVQ